MARLAVALLSALLVAPAAAAAVSSRSQALVRDAQEDMKSRPVMKVVRLLKDMQAELQKDLDDDKAVHEMLDCWCKTNDKEKTQAIELGKAKIAALESFLGEAAAQMTEMTSKRNEALNEVDRDYNALKEAQSLRMKENQEFHAEQVNLIEAIKSCHAALTALGKHADAAPNFAQVKEAAVHLQQASVLSKVVLSPTKLAALKAFLSDVTKAQGSTAFLAIPGFQSYAPQSGQIIGILDQMKEDFEKDLSDEEAKEKKNLAEFEALKAAKEEEISSGRKMVSELDQQIADLKEKHAQAFKELEGTQEQLGLDETFLANLTEKCSNSGTDFDKRVKDRLTEIAAVEDTIKILNDDKSFENFDKTVNAAASFVQVSRNSNAERAMRNQAVSVLEAAARKASSPMLSLLASRVQLDAFTEVKVEIDKMVVELKKQQDDEIQHKDWCIDELNKNNRSTEEGYDKKDSLTTKITDLEATIKELTASIEATTAVVAETQVQMKRASENREAENADFQETVVDQRVTQQILQKALTRMKQVYAFLESQNPGAAHTQTSATHTDPGNGPARFTEYSENKGGSKVVSMIEEVMADSRKTENEATASEEDGQTAYEQFMKESNAAIIAAGDKLVSMQEASAKAKEELSMAKTDQKSNMVTLEDLHNTNGDLHKACDFVMKNFEARQTARAAEVDALNEAKAILSGAQ